MFDIYGEMETAQEINAVARSLKEEGEKENLLKLCKENGIDTELAEMFWNGEIDFVTDTIMAAVGKLDMEVRALKKDKDLATGVADYLKNRAEENEDFALCIRKKEKRLEQVIKELWAEARKRKIGNSAYVPPRVVFKIAREYYERDDR